MFHNRSTFPSLKCINICTTALSSLPSGFLCSVSLPVSDHMIQVPSTATSPCRTPRPLRVFFSLICDEILKGRKCYSGTQGSLAGQVQAFSTNIHLFSNMPLLWGDSQWEKGSISSNLVFKHFLVDPSFPPLQLIEKAGYTSNPISSQCLMTLLTLQVSLPQLGTSLVTRVVAELPQ